MATVVGVHLHQRQSVLFFDQAFHRHGRLNRHRIGFDKQILEERVIFLVHLQCGLLISLKIAVHHLAQLFGKQIARHADDALGADGHERQRQGIVTAQDGKVLRQGGSQLAHAIGITAGFLDAHDVGAIGCQTRHRGHRDLHITSTGYAIEHDRQIGGLGNLTKMRVKAILRRLVVIRTHLQRAVGPGVLGGFGEIHRFFSGVGSRAGNHLAAPFGVMHHKLDNADVFFKFHGRRFAGCANWHDAVHATFHL